VGRFAIGSIDAAPAAAISLKGERESMQVRVRLDAGLSWLSKAPALTLELEEGATVDDLLACLRDTEPDLAPALRTALLVIGGVHAERRQHLEDREEIALLLPVSGG